MNRAYMLKRLPLVHITVLLLAVLYVLGWAYRPIAAQTPVPYDDVYSVAKQLNCPTCAGRNLADCPTDTCMQWKQEIQTQLQQGQSPQQVIDYFKARFGPSVLQEPPKEGAVLVLWVLPVIGLVALGLGAVVVLKRISHHPPTDGKTLQSQVSSTGNDDYVTRLEEEVREAGR